MRKFIVLLKKELRELLTPQVILPMALTLAVLNAVGKFASRERRNSKEAPRVAVMDLDASAASRAAVAALLAAGFAVHPMSPAPIEAALAAADRERWPALLVIPEHFGKGLGASVPQKAAVYAFLRTLSLAASLKLLAAARTVPVINEAVSARLVAERSRGSDPAFLRKPVAAQDYVVLNGRRAAVSIGQVMGFIQSQNAMIPVVMLLVIVIAAQMVATAVANEKENKTLETLLSLPVERDSIVLAKLCAAGIVAFLFAGIFLLGFSRYMKDVAGDILPGASGAQVASAVAELGLAMRPSGYLLLWTSLFFGILCALSIAMILGLLAEDVKGAQLATLPVTILVMIPYLLTLLTDVDSASPAARWLVWAIPFSHPFLAPANLLAGRRIPVICGTLYEVIVFLFFVTLATRLFSSEAVFTLKLPRFGKR